MILSLAETKGFIAIPKGVQVTFVNGEFKVETHFACIDTQYLEKAFNSMYKSIGCPQEMYLKKEERNSYNAWKFMVTSEYSIETPEEGYNLIDSL